MIDNFVAEDGISLLHPVIHLIYVKVNPANAPKDGERPGKRPGSSTGFKVTVLKPEGLLLGGQFI